MDRMVLEAQFRSPMSKGERKQMRSKDKVLAILYGRGEETMPLTIDGRSLKQVLITGGSNVLVDLAVQDEGEKTVKETVMFKEIQRDIIYQDRILHVDFIRISMTDKIEVAVSLNFIGEPVGLADGGVLSLVARDVLVRCLPGDIPEQFDLDIADLNIGDSATAEGLVLEGDVELITPVDAVLAQVLAPMAEEELEVDVEAEEELEEGEEVAEGEEGAEESPAAEGSAEKED